MYRKAIGMRAGALLLLFGLSLAYGCSRKDTVPEQGLWVTEADRHPPVTNAAGRVVRYGPIITPDMLPERYRRNLNSPWLIETPEWATNRLGRYYLYFASHRRSHYIRMAYADDVTGPWTIYEPGVFWREQGPTPRAHVSAPSVIVDEERQRFIMYFNSREYPGQRFSRLFVATSSCGLAFEYAGGPLGWPYSAVMRHDDWFYVFMGASGQVVHRSRDGVTDFEWGPRILPDRQGDTDPYSRHIGLQQVGDVLRVFFTQKRDAPERILMGTIDLTDDWQNWRVQNVEEVMRPVKWYEGAELPVTPSQSGPTREPVHELRDPALLESEGRTWLLYTIAGEEGIALAELLF